MVFTLMFVLVPHRRVLFRNALIGAFLSTVLFDLAKLGFVAYVSNANYTVIYGALATIPIFLFWLYLVWVVILLGASLAASLTTFADSERARIKWPESQDFQLLYRLVGHLWQAQRSGANLSDTQMLALEPHSNERQLQVLLHQLESAHIVARDEEGDWRLARDLEELTLSNLYCSGIYHLPIVSKEPVPVDSHWDRNFADTLADVETHGLGGLNKVLRDMYRGNKNQEND
jgi:membrane protein